MATPADWRESADRKPVLVTSAGAGVLVSSDTESPRGGVAGDEDEGAVYQEREHDDRDRAGDGVVDGAAGADGGQPLEDVLAQSGTGDLRCDRGDADGELSHDADTGDDDRPRDRQLSGDHDPG